MTFSNRATFQINRRRALAVVTVAIVNLTMPATLRASRRPPRVLFICQFGTAKSAIARELFKRRAAQRGIAVTVFSRGITPEPHLAPATRERLQAEGVDLDHEGVQMLRSADLSAADIVVAFNPLPSSMHKKNVRDWSALPSVNDSYPLARADLNLRIDLLLDSIKQMHR